MKLNRWVLAACFSARQLMAVAAPQYELTNLGILPGAPSAQAWAVNSSGQVCGQSGTRAFLWTGGVMKDLGILGDSPVFGTVANDVNDAGVVVGWSPVAMFTLHGFLYDGALQDIFGRGVVQSAVSINNKGDILANSKTVLLDGVTPWALKPLSASFPGYSARRINDARQVVGRAPNDVPLDVPVLWQGDAVTPLGVLPGTTAGDAFGINESGVVVGTCNVPGVAGSTRPFLWQNGTMTPLPFPNAAPASVVVRSINASGQIVGDGNLSNTSGQVALLWHEGQVYNLNTLVTNAPNWVLSNAIDINDKGEIVGNGVINSAEIRAFILKPVGGPGISGDVNRDGQFDLYDIIDLQRAVGGLLDVRQLDMAQADRDKDGRLTQADVVALKKLG